MPCPVSAQSLWISGKPGMYRESDLKSRSKSGAGIHGYCSVMCENDILNDRKPKTGSGRFGSEKRCKDFLQLFFGYAAAGIVNPDVDLAVMEPGFQIDGPGTVD